MIRAGVECPSLAPDNTRIAFKLRVAGRGWNIRLLDLSTFEETVLVEMGNVDDQVEWLDNQTLIYAEDHLWAVAAEGTGKPWIYLSQAYSPAVVR